MSSTTPPLLPNAAARPKGDGTPGFFVPMAKSVLVICIVAAVCWAGFVVLAVVVSGSAWLQDLLRDADLAWMPGSLRWFGRHAVAVNVAMLAICVAGAVAAWGLLRRHRWALWTFIVLLIGTAALNFAGVWVVDDVYRHLGVHLPTEGMANAMRLRSELQSQRVIYTSMMLVTSIAFAGLHAWLALRLLRPDVRRLFVKAP
ncbi:hypothetical protein [Stenotrophomonas sp. PD6]|uniref:hypothetical protein n=1 Tax=Stenotrophomonas sp. PD6 TaxID=3368612 RepID=UPI003BA1BBB8